MDYISFKQFMYFIFTFFLVQIFEENLEKENKKKSKNKDEFHSILQKYVNKKKNQGIIF